MNARTWKLSLTLLGLSLAPFSWAQEPGPLAVGQGQALKPPRPIPTNQQMADTIAGQLRQSGQLRGFSIDLAYEDGTVEISGIVADQTQREEALRIVQGVPGVERVRDRLTLTSMGPVTRTQATIPIGPAPTPVGSDSGPVLEGPKPGQGDASDKEPGPLPQKAAEASVGPEPYPIFQAPRPQAYDLNPPKMPPYSWPTYAPYNNYSRVAYPNLYPYQSWPFIGPNYPFPKVPLGWRSVKLEWNNGYWWYGHNATGHDWWRLRYW